MLMRATLITIPHCGHVQSLPHDFQISFKYAKYKFVFIGVENQDHNLSAANKKKSSRVIYFLLGWSGMIWLSFAS